MIFALRGFMSRRRFRSGWHFPSAVARPTTCSTCCAAKSATQNSLAIAERNLASTKGKILNIGQQDLVSKIQGFVDSAREAMKNNDWPRAQIQAHKAEVLSQEIFPNP